MDLLLLGASGSIGRQTIDILKNNRQTFSLMGFSVGHKTRYISKFIRLFPEAKHIYMQSAQSYRWYKDKYPSINFYFGKEGLQQLLNNASYDMLVNALVGFVGLEPTLIALENNKKVALANKESLVVGGDLILKLLDSGKGTIYPIDSEHSAVYKCLKVQDKNVEKIILTASGGAFRNLSLSELNNVTSADALRHPTWKMGPKITIDCATMMNKCFEVVEAFYLFRYPYRKIGVILHDESYVHSMVRYKDGYYRAEINRPDMHNPIEFALFEGEIPFTTYSFQSLEELDKFHFHQLDYSRYPLMKHAEKLLKHRGSYGTVLNAANEVAVHAFLNSQISFLDIEKVIDYVIRHTRILKDVNYEKICQIDKKTRQKANKIIKLWSKMS